MAEKKGKTDPKIMNLLKKRGEALDRLLEAKVELAKLDNELLKEGALSKVLLVEVCANW